jgi:DNA (cytosine-5)-methyltransferase 1
MTRLRLLSLFAGIGGFDLGAEMTGRFETVAFCEINPFARAVLAKHWPNVPCFPDVTKLTKDQINGPIDAICAGFPCQDLSFAGKGAGIEGARSGLWSEVVRLVGEIRPSIVMLENVPAILVRGLGRVLSDLAEIGYNAFWDCIRASDLGAKHHRDRWFLVAYPNGERGRSGSTWCGHAKDAWQPSGHSWDDARGMVSWDFEPDVGRVANGVPNRTHRLAALGNAIVPLWAFLVSKVAIAIYDQQEAAA